MNYVFIRFLEKWLETGRFPKQELRVRGWILALGGIVTAILVAALIAHA